MKHTLARSILPSAIRQHTAQGSTRASTLKRWALPLIIGFFLLKALSFSTHPVVLWDEAVYLGMGKYLASFGEIGLFEPFRPLLLPSALSVLHYIGVSLPGMKLFMLMIFAILMYRTYRLARHFLDDENHVLPFMLLSALYFLMSDQLMTGIPASLFLVLALEYHLQNRSYASGAMLGLAVATRYPAGLFLLLLCFLKKEQIQRALIGFALIIGPYLLILNALAGDVITNILNAASHQANIAYHVENIAYSAIYYPVHILLDNPLFLLVPAFFLYRPHAHEKKLALAVFIPLMYFTLIINKQPRFVHLFLPFLAILGARAFERVQQHILVRNIRWQRVALMLLILVTISNAVIRDGWHMTYHPREARPIETMYAWFNDHPGVVLSADPVVAGYSDVRVLPLYYSHTELPGLYESGITSADYVFWTRTPFVCEIYGAACTESLDAIEQKLAVFDVVYSGKHEGMQFTIYAIRKASA